MADPWNNNMDDAPRDGTEILVEFDHDRADFSEYSQKQLGPYLCWAEGGDHLTGKGRTVVAWGGGRTDGDWEGGYYDLPDWWFVSTSSWEVVVFPVRWASIPTSETTNAA